MPRNDESSESLFVFKTDVPPFFKQGEEVSFDGMYFSNSESTILFRSTRETSKLVTKVETKTKENG